MITVKFVNGLKEIGGTFVEVESMRSKCMFDFGFAHAALLDDRIRQRGRMAASQLARMGVLPVTDGIYDAMNAEALSVLPYGEPSVGKECFLLISHLHIDHIGGLGYLHPDVPVYMSRDSLKLYERLSAHGDVQGGVHKNCIGVDFFEPFTVGDITVTAMPVDHDIPGAAGFLIRGQGKTICYTGDFRYHGFHKELTREFAHRAATADVDLLICEGTTVSHDDINMKLLTAPEEGKRTEEDLQIELAERAQKARGLLLAGFYNRNVERVHRMIQTFKNNRRTLVLQQDTADYVSAFYPEDAICVYADTLSDSEVPKTWRRVTRGEISAHPAEYCLELPYACLYEAASLQGVATAYLHFDGAPLGDYDPAYATMLNVLESLGIAFERLGVSGHAEPYYLRLMIDTIAPRILVPLHSFRPEQVDSMMVGRRLLPEPGEVLTL